MARPILVSTLALVALAAGFGVWLGQGRSAPTETQAIEMVAQAYVSQTGGQPTDCAASPGPGDVWLRVRCGELVYDIDDRGMLIEPGGPET